MYDDDRDWDDDLDPEQRERVMNATRRAMGLPERKATPVPVCGREHAERVLAERRAARLAATA